MQTNEKIRVLGLMSGTSLDGLDLALCEFYQNNKTWEYSILAAKTEKYSSIWLEKLTQLPNKSALDWVETDQSYGRLLGEISNKFIVESGIQPDLISSHGHTIFHQPGLGFTGQIGNGACISAKTGLPTINDFRTYDVALEGQGAPLVPIGDELLFNKYSYCLNLGGISNISYQIEDKRVAFDICPVNQVLNYLAQTINLEYDNNGNVAKTGKIDLILLNQLNTLDYYALPFPKSLGREWVENEMLPIIDQSKIPISDKLTTVVEHIAIQIAFVLKGNPSKQKNPKLLITGGGGHNGFLIERIKFHTANTCICIVPDKLTLDFKEALIFAFLGLLRFGNTPNALKSVTGAKHDSVGGALYGDFEKLIKKFH